jgi:hypothetical protein
VGSVGDVGQVQIPVAPVLPVCPVLPVLPVAPVITNEKLLNSFAIKLDSSQMNCLFLNRHSISL